MDMIITGTRNAREGLIAGMKQLKAGASAIDAVETAIRVVEADPMDTTVGRGGFPNLLGEIELDASIMCGRTRHCGAVAAVKNYLYPISIARKVMELSPHVLLVGEGAELFAEAIGAEKGMLKTELADQMYTEMLTQGQLSIPESDSKQVQEIKERYNSWLAPFIEKLELREWHQKFLAASHGTVNVIASDHDGNLCTGVSTSGMALKYPGRVGDSPIIGAGNYADNRFGAVACVGVGELTIRLATARVVIEDLKRGVSLEQAALNGIKDVRELSRQGMISILVLDKDGNVTSATTEEQKRTYVVMDASMDEPEERQCVSLT
jgi:beta-aspartyl-peptidase (threonine type)